MASPAPRRESESEQNGETQPEQQGGVFIRYATINDIDEIKSRLDRHDDRMDRHDDKLDVMIADIAELKTGFIGLESRMGRVEDKLDKLNSYAFRILIAIIVGLIILLARDFFF